MIVTPLLIGKFVRKTKIGDIDVHLMPGRPNRAVREVLMNPNVIPEVERSLYSNLHRYYLYSV